MPSSIAALAATAFTFSLLTPGTLAQDQKQYTVWSSVIFQRTGERTPEVIGNIPTTLTSIGAQQAYASGQFYRDRYISSAANKSSLGSGNGAGEYGAPLAGLNADIISNLQTYAMALDQQWNVATAQAFLQGFYPPFTPALNRTGVAMLDPTSIMANGSLIDAPLSGYQYPQIHSSGALDPNFIYLSGNLDCPAFIESAAQYTSSQQFTTTQKDFDGIYDAIGPAVFEGILQAGAWDYTNAYAIYDYLQYQYAHNTTVQTTLDRYKDVSTNTSYLEILRRLANEQQYAQLGNLSAINPLNKHSNLPGASPGSISTIAGNTLAARVLDSLENFLSSSSGGGERYKLNLLFSDYAPLVSFFALMGLPDLNSFFYGMPNFGSSAAFELFSYTDSNSTSAISMPSTDDLWVKFYFVNGTAGEEGNSFRSYPLFNRGPDSTAMMWSDFRYSMQNILLGNVGDWCTECGAESIFCSAFNETNAEEWSAGAGLDGSAAGRHGGAVSPAAAGGIGAVVALAVAALVFVATMLFGGVRLQRPEGRRKSDLGGFKGGQKMRSDQDLSLPNKGGAVVSGGHERVGSWELKDGKDAGHLGVPETVGGVESGRPSMEQQGHDVVFGLKPVEAHERV